MSRTITHGYVILTKHIYATGIANFKNCIYIIIRRNIHSYKINVALYKKNSTQIVDVIPALAAAGFQLVHDTTYNDSDCAHTIDSLSPTVIYLTPNSNINLI